MSQIFTNNAATVLASAKAAGATTMVVQAGTGARFPTLAAGDFFELTLFKIVDGLEAAYEIVKVTARSIDTFTIVGAQQGTTPTAFGVGDQVSLRVTAGWLNKATTDIESKAPIASPTFTGNVAGVSKAMVGLSNVDNTSDANKPVSTAQQAALDLKAPIANPTFTGTVSGVSKAMVGLGNVDNTSDANKPVSTAQAVAIALKADAAGVPATVKANLTGYKNLISLSGHRAVTAADIGAHVYAYQADWAVTLPTPVSIGAKIGDTVTFSAIKGGAAQASIVLTPSGSAVLFGQVGLTSLTVMTGQQVELVSDGSNTWQVGMSTARLNDNAEIAAKAPIASPTFTGTVGGVSKAMVGLSNADNTSDANKPVSTAQQAALDLKAPIASPTFTGNVAGVSKAMVGLGNVDNTSDANKPVSTAQQAALDLKAPIASPTFTGTVGGVSKAMVGLSNADNTSDANKPVSTAQATAIALKADTTALTAGLATKAAVNGDAAQNFNVASLNGSFIGGMKNRIINGDMRINQRAVPSSGITTSGFTLDRWNYDASSAARFAYGPNLASTVGPAGFPYCLGFSAQGAFTPPANHDYIVQQTMEGHNLADLQYGTAGAKTCTLTAWVRSSITGTHSGSVFNLLAGTSFVFSFSIPTPNTWTFITVTIPGDTANAMNTNNTQGLYLRFNLGSGSDFLRAAGGWATGNMAGVTGSVNVLASNGSFLLTGVQFEVGAATPFSRRSMSEELALCQRYYEVGDGPFTYTDATGTYATTAYGTVKFAVTKRAAGSVVFSGWQYYSTGGSNVASTPSSIFVGASQFAFYGNGMTNWCGWAGGTWAASSEI